MTGFNSKRDAAADKDALFEKLEVEQPAQEPVTWFGIDFDINTTSPKREWVGLTPEETSGFTQHEMTVVKYVSKVLQEKNG